MMRYEGETQSYQILSQHKQLTVWNWWNDELTLQTQAQDTVTNEMLKAALLIQASECRLKTLTTNVWCFKKVVEVEINVDLVLVYG